MAEKIANYSPDVAQGFGCCIGLESVLKSKTKMDKLTYILLSLCLVAVEWCAAGMTIDQSQTGITNAANYNAASWQGQSFEPSLNWLFAVDLSCYPGLYIEGVFTVEIWRWRQTASGYGSSQDPRVGSQPLASSTITKMDTAWTPWVRWEFPGGVDLSAFVGQKLLILFKAQTNGLNCYLDTRNLYTKGDRYWVQYADNPDSGQWYWHRYSDWHDMTFLTWGSNSGDVGTNDKRGDVNKDGCVNFEDLLLLISSWLEFSLD